MQEIFYKGEYPVVNSLSFNPSTKLDVPITSIATIHYSVMIYYAQNFAMLSIYVAKLLANNFPDQCADHYLEQLNPLTLPALDLYYKCVAHNNFLAYIPFNYLDVRVFPLFLYFLSRLARHAACSGRLADRLYYLNRIIHGINIYHTVNLPAEFFLAYASHCILPNTTYGNRFVLYHGVSIGSADHQLPTFGNNVILMPNSIVSGSSSIGDNVVVAAGVKVINQSTPDGVIVYQSTDNQGLFFVDHDNQYIGKFFSD